MGVLHRVEALADRPEGTRPEGTRPYENLIRCPRSSGRSWAWGQPARKCRRSTTAAGRPGAGASHPADGSGRGGRPVRATGWRRGCAGCGPEKRRLWRVRRGIRRNSGLLRGGPGADERAGTLFEMRKGKPRSRFKVASSRVDGRGTEAWNAGPETGEGLDDRRQVSA